MWFYKKSNPYLHVVELRTEELNSWIQEEILEWLLSILWNHEPIVLWQKKTQTTQKANPNKKQTRKVLSTDGRWHSITTQSCGAPSGAPSSQFSSSLEGGSKSKEDTERASQKACDDVATALWGEKKVDTLHFEENGEGRCDKGLQNRRCNGLAKAS